MPETMVDSPLMKPQVLISPPAPAHEDAAAARRHWNRYEWPRGGDEWSEGFGGTDALWAGVLYPRLAALFPAKHVIEIGPGHGRVSRYLRGFAERLTLVDVSPRCAEACRQRFAKDPSVRVVVNDGRSLGEAIDGWGQADAIVSWSAMIGVERSTLAAYLKEFRRALRPGGVAFIHHSNAGSPSAGLVGDGTDKLGGRRLSQSAEGFGEDCKAAGLRCLSQELLDTNERGKYIDCVSWVMRDESGEAGRWGEPLVLRSEDWKAEIVRCTRISKMYRRPE